MVRKAGGGGRRGEGLKYLLWIADPLFLFYPKLTAN